MDSRADIKQVRTVARRPDLIRPPVSWAVTVALGLVGLYLLATHAGHVLEALPYLLLIACPLMHLFMHRSHGGHRH